MPAQSSTLVTSTYMGLCTYNYVILLTMPALSHQAVFDTLPAMSRRIPACIKLMDECAAKQW